MSQPRQPMPSIAFEASVFQLAKDPEQAEENQDVCRIDAARGIAAIADGVASSIFARHWARILVDAVADEEPDVADREVLGRWLAERRRAWQEAIDVESLAWFQKPKLREGAFSTLLWVRLMEQQPPESEDRPACRLRAFALGDTCLFFFRDGELIRAFPVERSDEFEADPLVVGSVDLGRDDLLVFESLDEPCREGDLLVLATDAVAEWILRRREAGDPLDWRRFWDMAEDQWREEIESLRAAGQMRYDDATLVLLRVTAGPTPAAGESAEAASEPPPLPAGGEDDWGEKVKHFSQRVAGEVSQHVSSGMQKFRQMRESAQSAIKKYRDKLREDR